MLDTKNKKLQNIVNLKPPSLTSFSQSRTFAFVLALSSIVFLLVLAGRPSNPMDSTPERPIVRINTTQALLPLVAPVETPYIHSTDTPNNDTDSANHTNSSNVSSTPMVSPYPELLLNDTTIQLDNQQYPLRDYSIAAIPNDPGSGQWWEAAINAPAAWDISTGSQETILAIIDTGFALQHEEFANRWHENSSEIGPTLIENPSILNCSDQSLALNQSCNAIDDNFDGIVDNESGYTTLENDSILNCSDQFIALDKSCNLYDDDGNGLADDVTGWDFINFDRSVQAGETNPNGSGTRHGSYVAGVAAANTDNGSGIAGVNWNTKILPIQAIDDDGYGNSLSVARAINYAVSQGADVISMSLGGAFPDNYLRLSLQNALANGVVLAAASGNDGCDCISYPANYPEIIAVGALDYSLERASFSSYGNSLDITAPGVGMYTASWSPSNETTAYASGIAGTSLATPLVGAALATLKAQQPNASPLQLTAALLESADQSMLTDLDQHSSELGFGRLDLAAASQRMNQSFTPQIVYNFGGLYTDDANDVYNIYQCNSGIRGGSGLYSATNGSNNYVSASLTNIFSLQLQGYTANLLAYGCVLQPHDIPTEKRQINTASELLDIFIK